MTTSIKSIQTALKYITKVAPEYYCVQVKDGMMHATDLETYVTIKDDHGHSEGFHRWDMLGHDRPQAPFDVHTKIILDGLGVHQDTCKIEVAELLQTNKHASKDETRIYLNGVYFHDSAMVGCNGHTIRKVELAKAHDVYCQFDDEVLQGQYIMPRTSIDILKRLIKIYKKTPKEIAIKFYENFSVIETSEFRIAMRHINREFPRYQSAMPARYKYKASITKGIDYKRLKGYCLGRDYKCALIFKQGQVTLVVPGAIEIEEVIGTCDESLKTKIGFNMMYLDLAAEGQKEFEIQFNNELSPTFINKSIVMPLRL